MGGCTNSKYALDEDKKPKKEKKPLIGKKSKNKKDAGAVDVPNGDANAGNHVDEGKVGAQEEQVATEQNAKVAEKEEIEFIDKEDAEKQAKAAAGDKSDNEDTKKEVTTYQTTVVKHTQKEGDELLQHLRDEAFRTLQNLLKQQSNEQPSSASSSSQPGSPSHHQTTTTRTTTASTSSNKPQTVDEQQEDIVQQIKDQVLNSLGKSKQEVIVSIIDSGTELIRDNQVKSMNELQQALEAKFPEVSSEKDGELVKKVINATTGYLTAKGTEAGALLSNILANVNNGIQGVMNEVEKTTVKVTRTITEQVMTGGQIKEITRVIQSTEPVVKVSNNIQDVLKNLSNGLGVDGSPIISNLTVEPVKVVQQGSTTTTSSHHVDEKHEVVEEHSVVTSESVKEEDQDLITKRQAEQVVSHAVNAAVEKVLDESNHVVETSTTVVNGLTNGHHEVHEDRQVATEEAIKIEEESSVRTSTTKILLNGNNNVLDQAQSEFYKHGKESAEDVVKKIVTTTLNEVSSNEQPAESAEHVAVESSN